MSLPVLFLYAWRAELKIESRLAREVDREGVLDIIGGCECGGVIDRR